MNLTKLVRHSGIKQNTLGGSGLAGVDMRHDADIPVSLDGCFSCHSIPTLNLNCPDANHLGQYI
jgi:hypothetical protein